MLKKLDPVLHNELRLAIVSLLISLDKADFNYLLEQTGASRGNLSVQISKLKEAGYIEVNKGYKDNFPHTSCVISKSGIDAFEEYVNSLQHYLHPPKGGKKQ